MAVRKIETELSLSGERAFNDGMKAANSNLKTLKSEMALVKSEFDGQANSVDALRAKQRVLTDQYDQQNEKVKALEKMLDKARSAYGDNSAQVDKYQQQLNNAKVQLNKFGNELEDTNKYLKEAEESSNGAAKSIDEFGKQVGEAGGELNGSGGLISSLSQMKQLLVGGAVVTALKEIGSAVLDVTKAGAAYADEVLTMATVTGLSTETLQEYMYMSDLVDVSVDTVTGSITKLKKSMDSAREGTGASAEAFAQLGVQIIDADGNLRNAEDVFYDVIDALGTMTNETERDIVTMDLMGKSAQDLNPLIEAGTDALNDFRTEAHETGAVLSDETLSSLGEVQDSFDRLDQQMTASKNKLAEEFAPAVKAICDELIEAWDKVTDAIIKAHQWLQNTKIGGNMPSNQPGSYSNISGGYTNPDEEFYGTNNSYLDKIKNGSHASGLDYVPFDGYIAELHKGEAVLTKNQAAVLRQMSSRPTAEAVSVPSSGTTNRPRDIVINLTSQLDGRTLAAVTYRYNEAEKERHGNSLVR